jgi:amino acid adenylation domain-containing protein
VKQKSDTPILRRLTSAFLSGKSKTGGAPIQTTAPSIPITDQSAYWRELFRHLPARLDLPARCATSQRTGAPPARTTITAPLVKKLEALGDGHATDELANGLLATYICMLYRHTGQQEIALACASPDHDAVFFIRVDVAADAPFRLLLTHVADAVARARANLAVAPEKILRDTLSASDAATWLQVQFSFLSSPTQRSALASLNPSGDLHLLVTIEDGQLSAQLLYNANLYSHDTAQGMLSHYATLLSAIADNPAQPPSLLNMMSDDERDTLLKKWNASGVRFPAVNSVQELFEARAAATPAACAIAFNDQRLSYDEVNTRANQLAHHLRGLGVRANDLVGVYMERGTDAVVAILAVLKSGGAYLPLDASYPQERLAFIMQDAGARVLLTHARHVSALRNGEATVICLDADGEAIATRSGDNPERRSLPQHPAFVLYTSGSTGNPKGVVVSHGNLINYYFAWEHTHQLQASINAVFQMTYFSFAVFQGDVVRALCSGKKLVICPREALLSPQQLYELMRDEQADFAEFVPVLLRGLLEFLETSGSRLDFMRVIIVGADRWYVREHRRVQRLCGPQTRFVHVYGLSETTLDSTYFVATTAELDEHQLVPIGRPFPNVQAYVLDAHRRPVPVGVTGTLYIGGAGVAGGYYNRPDLTAERFIADPFSEHHGARLYNTGDLARYLADGNIAFLGRSDQQVKIRGFRVELGEVEACLEQHPAIRAAVVQAWQPTAGTTQLAAYYVATENQTPATSEIQQFLARKLPDFMVPSYYMALEALPLTPSGKINRRALPDPRESSAQTAGTAPASADPIEQAVSEICKHALGLIHLPADARFAEFGADSAAIMSMVTGIENNFGVVVDENDIGPNLFTSVETVTRYVKSKTGSARLG